MNQILEQRDFEMIYEILVKSNEDLKTEMIGVITEITVRSEKHLRKEIKQSADDSEKYIAREMKETVRPLMDSLIFLWIFTENELEKQIHIIVEGKTDLNRRSRVIKEIENKIELLTFRAVDFEKDVRILKGCMYEAGWQGKTAVKKRCFMQKMWAKLLELCATKDKTVN